MRPAGTRSVSRLAVAPGSRSRGRAFTLVELVIALTILGILAGMAIPAIDGVQKERVAREPINALLLMAREARGRAMAEQRPYQIAFDAEGFHAARYFHPYGGAEEFEQLRLELDERERLEQMIEASRARGMAPAETEPDPRREAALAGFTYSKSYTIEPGLRYRLRMWGDTDWQEMDAGLFRRWVFQPSGMCEPLLIQVENERAFFEVEFHPLTGDIRRERSWIE